MQCLLLLLLLLLSPDPIPIPPIRIPAMPIFRASTSPKSVIPLPSRAFPSTPTDPDGAKMSASASRSVFYQSVHSLGGVDEHPHVKSLWAAFDVHCPAFLKPQLA